jgi:hypothetical protein
MFNWLTVSNATCPPAASESTPSVATSFTAPVPLLLALVNPEAYPRHDQCAYAGTREDVVD